ncbi:MAG TPA: hypothetical protein VGN38_05570 [Caulobacteraceae bacterium]|jgi:hypothetical protein|nr:hypothetical protein [Caulobacteraceae bacterium]
MTNNDWLIVACVVIAVLIIAVIVLTRRQQATKRLKSRFGSEYERTLDELGGQRKAEAELHQREQRVEKLELKPLEPDERSRFTDRWRRIQSAFVDDPGTALTDADRLVGEVMTARGYPSADFEERSADVSVDHAEVIESYRKAHAIALRNQKGEAGTEDLRQAMVAYRTLFDDLVGAPANDVASDHQREELAR